MSLFRTQKMIEPPPSIYAPGDVPPHVIVDRSYQQGQAALQLSGQFGSDATRRACAARVTWLRWLYRTGLLHEERQGE